MSEELIPVFHGISGPDSDEILSDLLTRFGGRIAVSFHRAIISNNDDLFFNLINDPNLLEVTLLPLNAYAEVKKCNELNMELLNRMFKINQEPFATVPQLSGVDGDPNELYPNGDAHEPETNLDTVFWTPLLRACQSGNVRYVRSLIEKGANRNYQSPSGSNVISVLLDGYCKVENMPDIIRAVATDENIVFETHIARVLGREEFDDDVEVLKVLLRKGAVIPEGALNGDLTWLPSDMVAVLEDYV